MVEAIFPEASAIFLTREALVLASSRSAMKLS